MNKWIRAAIPALMIHTSIGTVYCWSTFKEAIASQIGMSTFSVGWAFSLAIFFLGMSAAFAGNLVEMDIHKSSFVACVCFFTGMIGTGITIQIASGIPALIGIYLFYGCIMGVGLGVGYLTPIKTLMLWFNDRKGLATGISIMGFGLAKAIATPIMEWLQKYYGISMMFYILGIVYCVMMFVAHLLLKKPDGWVEGKQENSKFKLFDIIQNKLFVMIWIMFYINIHCGLMLITYEKQIIQYVFVGSAAVVSVIPVITAACNALGRLGYSSLSDGLKDRMTVYMVIFWTCLATTTLTFVYMMFADALAVKIWIVLLLMIVNLGYGGGFSTLPALLSQKFGMENISKIHGMALTAWAVAGITGNNLSELILQTTGGSYESIFVVTMILYGFAFVLSIVAGSKKRKTNI